MYNNKNEKRKRKNRIGSIKRKIALIIALIGIFVASINVLADGKRNVSPRIAEIEAEIRTLDYEQYRDRADALETEIMTLREQLYTVEKEKNMAEEKEDSVGVSRAEMLISNIKKELAEKEENLSEYRLQLDMNIFYVENKDKLVSEEEEIVKYECYAAKINIAKSNAQLEYLKCGQSEFEKRTKAEQSKMELGYATSLDVSVIQNELDQMILSVKEVNEEIDYQKNILAIYEEENVAVELPEHLEELDGDFVSQFYNNNMQVKYYVQQIKAYGNYIENAEESDDGLSKMKLQMELLDLKQQQYKIELEKYVKQNEKLYKQDMLQTEQYDYRIDIVEQKIKNGRLLLDKGKNREIDIMELETEKARLEYEKKSVICDAMLRKYALEHNIYI